MNKRFHVPERGSLAILADGFMTKWVMPVFAKKGESPQLTHFWNNVHLKKSEVDHLDQTDMVACRGDPDAQPRVAWWDFRFHLGGWKKYVVLEPEISGDPWYVGWIVDTSAGVSQIPVYGRVRMLIGDKDVRFFGIRATDYRQIKIRTADEGELGDESPNARLPLH